MTTKNLSRSGIEGGRTGHYKAECRKKIRQERAAWRTRATAIALDPEAWEDDVPAVRAPAIPDFDDKLSPMYRFLDSRVGRPWDGVRSELFSRFDTRTTPGRHVLFDHLLRDVSETPMPEGSSSWLYLRRYYRDEGGILRKDMRWAQRWRGSGPAFDLGAVARWLGARKVGRAGAGFAQYVAASFYGMPLRHEVRAVVERGQLAYAFVSPSGGVLRREVPPVGNTWGRVIAQPPALVVTTNVSFRQDGLLDAEDAAYMRALPERVREAVCALAPANF